jgi:hypothetical protein
MTQRHPELESFDTDALQDELDRREAERKEQDLAARVVPRRREGAGMRGTEYDAAWVTRHTTVDLEVAEQLVAFHPNDPEAAIRDGWQRAVAAAMATRAQQIAKNPGGGYSSPESIREAWGDLPPSYVEERLLQSLVGSTITAVEPRDSADAESGLGRVILVLDDGRRVEFEGWGHDWWGLNVREVR